MQDDPNAQPQGQRQPEQPTPTYFTAPQQGISTPSQQPTPAEQQPHQPRKKRSTKKQLFLFGGIGLGVLLLILAFIFTPRILRSIELARLDTGLPYIYLPAKVDVPADQALEFPLGFKPDVKTDRFSEQYDQYIKVYSDEAFTKEAMDTLTLYSQDKFKITPNPSVDLTGAYDVRTRQDVEIMEDRHWGIHNIYYVVQYVDFTTGKKLEKPVVQPFTVKHELAAPDVQYTFDDQGNINLSWNKVEGATAYLVGRADAERGGGLQIYSATDQTSWSTKEETNGLAGFTQNKLLAASSTQDDDQYSGLGSIDNEDKFKQEDDVDIAVIALNDTSVSAFKPLDTVAIRSQAPYSFATQTAKAMNIEVAGEVANVNDIPANVPVTLADGRTALQRIEINPDDARISNSSLFDTDLRRYITTLDVPYTVRGTGLNWTYRVTDFDANNYKQQLTNVIAANKDKQIKTGAASFALLNESDFSTENKTIATSRPSTAYKVNASNPFTDYLAANLMNGAEVIDVSKYVSGESVISPDDAFQEALNQNPYIMYVTGYYYSPTKKQIQVQYGGGDKAARDTKTKQLNEKVKSIVGTIIKPGMSETEKVNAINKYIIDTTTYNYDALEFKDSFLVDSTFADSWTAYGTLIDGLAVCGGYSVGFKALANEAGLESVYVTGYLDNTNRHAWNKVKVDGKWRVVDTTWNDSPTLNRYLLITDEQAESQRSQVEDKYWISDPFLNQYPAN